MELELEEPQIVGDNECKYKCTTCNKCFNSHQALGGHRSSHNKSNKIIHDHHQDYYESNIVVMDDDDDQKAELAAIAAAHHSSVVVHQCKICDKVFPTGQALGGHKRCHWTGLTEPVQAPSSQITSAGEGGGGSQSASGCRKVLDFDLNEIPIHIPLEEDGITIGLGNEYASSSYNSNMG
uniref:zinc finger protein ZAT6-like n=1 Tax=Erigeron canadensis TaxID=72917 RepID=UPI001CB9B693|nr:zinc finger protein ZAT6-like [Erigeron canadensis]